jgi:two-component system sensor histidine kinase KdpD
MKDESLAERKASRDALVDGALEAADRLNRIVEDILSMSRIESGNLALSLSLADPADLAAQAIAAAGDDIDPARVAVAVSGEPGPAMMDFGLVKSMIANLLRNAGRYSAPGSPVELRLAEEGGRLLIDVRDRGPGVPEADLGAIFERFKRGRNAKGGGVGLGLAICRGIALAHGGSIAARNAIGGGLVVRAEIPVRPAGRKG